MMKIRDFVHGMDVQIYIYIKRVFWIWFFSEVSQMSWSPARGSIQNPSIWWVPKSFLVLRCYASLGLLIFFILSSYVLDIGGSHFLSPFNKENYLGICSPHVSYLEIWALGYHLGFLSLAVPITHKHPPSQCTLSMCHLVGNSSLPNSLPLPPVPWRTGTNPSA